MFFIDYIVGDEDYIDGVVVCVVGLIGDLCIVFGKDVLKLVEVRLMIYELLIEGWRLKINKVKIFVIWVIKELRKLKN